MPNASMPLSPEQIRFFQDEGYLVVENLIPVADLQPVMEEINDEIEIRAQKLFARGELSQTYSNHGFETRLAKISEETDKLAVSIWNGILHGPAIFHLISHPRLVDVAEQLCQTPEIIASSVYRLRPKIPHYGYGAVPWHQDSSYFEPYCDNSLVLTAWVPLVDADEENGCMWVIPGTHRLAIVPHQLAGGGKYLGIEEKDLPAGKRLCCPVRKGGALLITNRTVHGSFENETDGVRWSMDLRYQSAALPTNAPITRLPGETLASQELGVPAACYPPDRDFLVRSRQRPDEITRTYRAIPPSAGDPDQCAFIEPLRREVGRARSRHRVSRVQKLVVVQASRLPRQAGRLHHKAAELISDPRSYDRILLQPVGNNRVGRRRRDRASRTPEATRPPAVRCRRQAGSGIAIRAEFLGPRPRTGRSCQERSRSSARVPARRRRAAGNNRQSAARLPGLPGGSRGRSCVPSPGNDRSMRQSSCSSAKESR